MELAGPLLEIVKFIWSPTCNCIDRHRKFEEDVNEFISKLEDLDRRKQDIRSRMQAEVHSGVEVKQEVQGWLGRVEEIDGEMKAVEQKLQRVKWYSRSRLGKLVRKKIDVVKGVYDQGNFVGSLVISRTRTPTRGIMLPTEDLKGGISAKEKIWGYLMGDEVGMIGVCGIGGVGKTTIIKHINNDLLNVTKFDKVIWVTVSYSLNVIKLQEYIARGMNERLPEDVDEVRRAAALMDIMERVRYVLILDDVWESFSLESVGIPKPTRQNGCKVVITSRCVDICSCLDCEPVKVLPLSPEESLNLFLEKVGRNIIQVPEYLQEILKLVVEECAGLPLAIVVVARSLKGVGDICEWRNALVELQERVHSVKGLENEIFERLRFSYDRLKNSKIQDCFLYCSLYPEDYPIHRPDLIECWIDEGLIDELGSRQAKYDRGHAILNRLENSCLLEECTDERFVNMHDVAREMALRVKSNYLVVESNHEGFVKMHDIVRDMALRIKSVDNQFMVKAGLQLTEVPDELEWTEDLEKVSLMNNKISRIPLSLSPKCPALSTLILRDNRFLRVIPESFFESMPRLKILDLSYTDIEVLPNSISNLENLTALRLSSCYSLKYLPSLAKLKALKKLDLHQTGIAVAPQGMEMLICLEYLDLYCPLDELPVGILSNLSCLQYLVVDWALKIKGEEVEKMRKLETLRGHFYLQEFNNYVKSGQFQNLINYLLVLGESDEVPDEPITKSDRCVVLSECEIREEDRVVLRDDLQELQIRQCINMRSLSDVALVLQNARELSYCSIWNCEEVECVLDLVSSSSLCSHVLKLQTLVLGRLPKLCELVKVEGTPMPLFIFSSLKYFDITGCSGIRKLFPVELLQGLQNLEAIEVNSCEQMEEIIALDEEQVMASNAYVKYPFPNLREMKLSGLPQLKSICSARGVMVCDSLKYVIILDCPKLKRISLDVPLINNGEPSPPPSLERIWIDSKEWWEALEWDNPNVKNVLQPLLANWW